MKKYIYYHVYLPDESAAWSSHMLEQYKAVEDSGLMDEVESLNVVLVGKEKNAEMAIGLAKTFTHKINFFVYPDIFKGDEGLHTLDSDLHGRNQRPITEFGCLNILNQHALAENAYFLYMHAKGVTSFERCLRAGRYEEFKNYLYWRKFLEWGTIENWRVCVNALDNGYDTAGCNYTDWPMKHYSGNFWWASSEYIKTLNRIDDDNWWNGVTASTPAVQPQTWRLRDEMWILSSPTAKIYSIKNADRPPPTSNLATDFMPRKKYV